MDTNLYDFLRTIHRYAAHASIDGIYDPYHKIQITQSEFDWLSSYLRNPGTLIEFRSRPTGRTQIVAAAPRPVLSDMVEFGPDAKEEIPELEQHYALAGTAEEVFCLLTEAMLLNPTFASLVVGAGRYYTEHVPLCRKCSQRHNGRSREDCPDVQAPKWEFKQREQ